MKFWYFNAGMVTAVVVLLAGYGLHSLQDDIARARQGLIVTSIIQDILNTGTKK